MKYKVRVHNYSRHFDHIVLTDDPRATIIDLYSRLGKVVADDLLGSPEEPPDPRYGLARLDVPEDYLWDNPETELIVELAEANNRIRKPPTE